VRIHFTKYHGLGNDFLVVEGRIDAQRARHLCARTRGVGADGVIAVLPPRAGGMAAMHLFNSDGSEAEISGNGLRCVARHLADTRRLSGSFEVETDAGPKRCTIHRDDNGKLEDISAEMGPARWEGEQEFTVAGERLQGLRVNMGNPHAVFLGEASLARARALGPAVEGAVPGGVNAGFAAVRAGAIDLWVWERGDGLTEACGSGACAAALAAVKTGLLRPGVPIEVRLTGGSLAITVDEDLTRVTMRGPAVRVFEGEADL
jgi:diaminopimelate epimerase